MALRSQITPTSTTVMPFDAWLKRYVSAVVMGLVLGVAAAALGVWRAWEPSLWLDEIATIIAVDRSWTELFAMLARTDAVHGLFYVLTKPWTDLVGTSPTTLRLPSSIFIGIAVFGMVLLADRLIGRTAALWAGVLLAVFPAVTGAAVEARSGAMTIAVAVAANWLFVQALARPGRRGLWIGYTATMVAGGVLFFPMLSLWAAHGITLLWGVRRREVVGRWLGAMVAGTILVTPFLVLVGSQRGQVSWIRSPTVETVIEIFLVDAWFRTALAAAVAWLLILLAAWRTRTERAWVGTPSAISLAVPWALVPIVALTAVSLVLPMLLPRYLLFSAPALVLLMVAGVRVFPVHYQIIPVLAFVLACMPAYLHQRTEYAKGDPDWAAAARVVADGAHPGDAVLFLPETHGMKYQRSPRRAMDGYPEAFTGLDDPGLIATGRQYGVLWGEGLYLDEAVERLGPGQKAWILVSRRQAARPVGDARKLIVDAGLDPVLVWKGPQTLVFSATR